MLKPFLFVVALGAGIGFLMPSGEKAPAAESPAADGNGAPPPVNAAQISPTAPLTELTLNRRGDGHFYVEGLVNGQETHFLIDTGASHIALTMDDAKRLRLPVSEDEFEYVGQGAGGAVRGQIVTLDRVVIAGRVVTNARAAVLEGLHVSLLGQSVLSQLGTLQMSGDRLILR
jgi:aspartyl protease family protein